MKIDPETEISKIIDEKKKRQKSKKKVLTQRGSGW